VIYAYAICEPDAAEPPPRRRGLGGAALRTLEQAGLVAVYSRHRSLRPRPSREAILVHERVVEEVMARGAVLPLRFGTQLEDEDRLAAALSDRHEGLQRVLDRVRGRVELGLRVLPVRPDAGAEAAPQGSGREYLLERVSRHRRAERAARELNTPLAALASASRVKAAPAPPAILVAAYLLDPGDAPEFRARAHELAARHDDLQAVVTGPWPPYSFVAEDDT
jgi:hypothetical protein